ncbi:MAG: DUF4258 domain-containing protein, partial [Clostridia bacterium]|nr:DUF4258 domain-containing protein [Clostridia bacterium]
DPVLPAGETVNCHCICQPVVNEGILGLSIDERKELQRQAIDEMDADWERELNERNMRRGIPEEELANLGLQKSLNARILKEWGEELHPRDEAGRFASGGIYDVSKIIGNITCTGTKIKNVSKHARQRMKQRKISADTVSKVLTSIKTKATDGHTANTKVYASGSIRVVVDETRGNIVTCIDKRK